MVQRGGLCTYLALVCNEGVYVKDWKTCCHQHLFTHTLFIHFCVSAWIHSMLLCNLKDHAFICQKRIQYCSVILRCHLKQKEYQFQKKRKKLNFNCIVRTTLWNLRNTCYFSRIFLHFDIPFSTIRQSILQYIHDTVN